jgi:hypothetical protein
MMKMNHDRTYIEPLKAASAADTIVKGKATLEAKAVMESTDRAIVTGKGIILDDVLVSVVVMEVDVLLLLDWHTPLTAV